MNIIQLQIILIASLVAIASVLPGVFLVLRGVALMSDAISHAILLGIAGMFLIVQQLESPWLIIGAALAGIATVVLTEAIVQTQCLKKDAAIGLVFPLFFSLGIIIISQYARNIHLDMDMVILGELAFAPFNRLILYNIDCGPFALWSMGIIALLNITFVTLFYKELQLTTFDSSLAHILGFTPTFVYYGLMIVTSITAVGAFDAVGSIVLVALMITPPATAYLLTNRLPSMIGMSIIIGILSTISGYIFAHHFDVSIAGSMATMNGIIFLLALLCAPHKGICAHLLFTRKKQISIAQDILYAYLAKHKSANRFNKYNKIDIAAQQLGWSRLFMHRIVRCSINNDLLTQNNNYLLIAHDRHNKSNSI